MYEFSKLHTRMNVCLYVRISWKYVLYVCIMHAVLRGWWDDPILFSWCLEKNKDSSLRNAWFMKVDIRSTQVDFTSQRTDFRRIPAQKERKFYLPFGEAFFTVTVTAAVDLRRCFSSERNSSESGEGNSMPVAANSVRLRLDFFFRVDRRECGHIPCRYSQCRDLLNICIIHRSINHRDRKYYAAPSMMRQF